MFWRKGAQDTRACIKARQRGRERERERGEELRSETFEMLEEKKSGVEEMSRVVSHTFPCSFSFHLCGTRSSSLGGEVVPMHSDGP